MSYPDLTTLAMLGQMGKGFFEQFGIDTGKTFKETLDANPDLPADQRVKKAMAATQHEVLTKAPVWMRFNMMSHQMASAKKREVPESDLDWDVINKYLTENTQPTDFNNFSRITSYDSFYEALDRCISAQADLIPWRVEKCKDCGGAMYLYQGEIKSYLDKNLNLPKRCKKCRDKRKGIIHSDPKPTPKKENQKVEEKTPTAMEIAMRKAGLIK